MTILEVSATTEARAGGDIAPVIASLPVSLVAAGPDAGGPDLVAVDGGPGWPQRAADRLAHGVRGLVVIQPVPVAPAEVPTASGVPVVVDYRFAGNPAIETAADAFARWPADAMIEVSVVGSDSADLGRILVDQLATLRRLGQAAAELDRLTWRASGYYLRGATATGSPLLVSAHVTIGEPSALRVRGLAADGAVELTVPNPGTARPAYLVRITRDGATTAPSLWETSHRAAWRRLHAAVTETQPTADLSDLRKDLAVAGRVLPTP
jgi:hypothetical protein